MGQEIQIKGKDGDFMGYLATPAGGSGPGIICIQEVFGVNTWMRNIADDFAAQGYVALVPDLFWRLEPGVQINGEGEEDFAKAPVLVLAKGECEGLAFDDDLLCP